jgi:hypothetical protein
MQPQPAGRLVRGPWAQPGSPSLSEVGDFARKPAFMEMAEESIEPGSDAATEASTSRPGAHVKEGRQRLSGYASPSHCFAPGCEGSNCLRNSATSVWWLYSAQPSGVPLCTASRNVRSAPSSISSLTISR